MLVGPRVVEQDDFPRPPGEAIPDVRLDPALPVAVPERRGARRDGQLARDVEVVRHGVGGQMRQVPEGEGAQRPIARAILDLLAHRPRVAMPAGQRVLLRDARVGGDGPVQEIVRERAEQVGGDPRHGAERPQHGFPQEDVRPGRPGECRRWQEHNRGECRDRHHPDRPGGAWRTHRAKCRSASAVCESLA